MNTALNVRAEILSVYWLKLPQKEIEGERRSIRHNVYSPLLVIVKLKQKEKKIPASFCIKQWQQNSSDRFSSHSEKSKNNNLKAICGIFFKFYMCAVKNCSPAVYLVRFAWLGAGRVGTESAPQWVELSSPHLTAGSRNLELDLQVCSPIKTGHF